MSTYEIKKTITGAKVVKFPCPNCGVLLTEKFIRAGEKDTCPDCGSQLIVPGLAEKESEEREQQEAELKSKLDAAQKQVQKRLELQAQEKARQQKQLEIEQSRQQPGQIESIADSFGLGFLINPKPFLSGPIYQYQNKEFPALAAAIRYYAFIARLIYYISLTLLGIGLLCNTILAVVAIFTAAATADLEMLGIVGIALCIFVLFGLIAIVFCNLWLVVSLAACEVARVLLQIEVNTRNR